MPCYATGSAEGDAHLAADEARKELTKVTQLLCSVLEIIERHHHDGIDFEIELPKPVKVWWKKHKKIDAQRRKEEKQEKDLQKVKAAALKKLTPQEKKILRIK